MEDLGAISVCILVLLMPLLRAWTFVTYYCNALFQRLRPENPLKFYVLKIQRVSSISHKQAEVINKASAGMRTPLFLAQTPQ
jgi:hypothetical protein